MCLENQVSEPPPRIGPGSGDCSLAWARGCPEVLLTWARQTAPPSEEVPKQNAERGRWECRARLGPSSEERGPLAELGCQPPSHALVMLWGGSQGEEPQGGGREGRLGAELS